MKIIVTSSDFTPAFPPIIESAQLLTRESWHGSLLNCKNLNPCLYSDKAGFIPQHARFASDFADQWEFHSSHHEMEKYSLVLKVYPEGLQDHIHITSHFFPHNIFDINCRKRTVSSFKAFCL